MSMSFERWGLRGIGVAGIATGLADFADPFLATPSLDGAIASVGLTLIGALLLFLASDAARTDEHRQALLERLRAQEVALADLRAMMTKDALKRLGEVETLLKPDIALLGARKARSLFEEMNELVRRMTFEWRDPDAFRTFYLDTLRELEPGVTLIATSRTETHYFWSGTDVAREMERFIQRGGIVRRAFILETGDLDKPERLRILDHQVSLGVQVFTVDAGCLAGRTRLILGDEASRFGWEVFTTNDGRIERAQVTADPEKLGGYRQYLNRVRACPSLKAYGGHGAHF